jgi:hypothetical protein
MQKIEDRSGENRALRRVNEELVVLYWEIGREILDRQEREGWGANVIDRLAAFGRTALPTGSPADALWNGRQGCTSAS